MAVSGAPPGAEEHTMQHSSFSRSLDIAAPPRGSSARRWAASSAIALACVTALGCGSDSTDGDGGGAGCVEGRRPGADLAAVANSEFCSASAAALPEEVACAYALQTCGVPLQTPPGDLSRSENVLEFSGSGAPRVDCYSPDAYPEKVEPDPSKLVTVTGEVKLFSKGCQSREVTIEFYTVNRSGGADDGKPDKLIGTAVTTPDDCQVDGVESEKSDSCSTTTGNPFHCLYSYPDVPTDTELLVKTDGSLWAPLYEYNVFIPSSAATAGTFEKDIRTLAQDDYSLISKVAIGGSITPTHGAVAGEVHDCDDVRLIDAIVDVDADKKILTYFSSDEDRPLPLLSAAATTTLALYAAIDVPPGPVSVGAVGLVGGQPMAIGFFKAQVFPDSVTSVTFRGLRPFQVP
jgi:hypothetical protein